MWANSCRCKVLSTAHCKLKKWTSHLKMCWKICFFCFLQSVRVSFEMPSSPLELLRCSAIWSPTGRREWQSWDCTCTSWNLTFPPFSAAEWSLILIPSHAANVIERKFKLRAWMDLSSDLLRAASIHFNEVPWAGQWAPPLSLGSVVL